MGEGYCRYSIPIDYGRVYWHDRYCYVDVPISIDIRTNMLVLIDSDFTHEGVPIRIVIRTNVYVGISRHVSM